MGSTQVFTMSPVGPCCAQKKSCPKLKVPEVCTGNPSIIGVSAESSGEANIRVLQMSRLRVDIEEKQLCLERIYVLYYMRYIQTLVLKETMPIAEF